MRQFLEQASLNRPGVHFVLWKLGLVRALTQTTEAETEYLRGLAANQKCIVEIGVWHGVNSREMGIQMDKEGALLAIDPFFSGRFGFKWHRSISKGETRNLPQVQFIEKLSQDAVAEVAEKTAKSIDLLFIDGDHSRKGVASDWILFRDLVRVGGVVAFHDSRSHEGRDIEHTDVVRFVNEEVRTNPDFELHGEVDSISAFRRLR